MNCYLLTGYLETSGIRGFCGQTALPKGLKVEPVGQVPDHLCSVAKVVAGRAMTTRSLYVWVNILYSMRRATNKNK
jgi:hypothetical protein